MENNNNIEQPEIIEIPKKRKGRPRKYNYDTEGKILKYIETPRPGYHTKYYHSSNLSELMKCEICECEVTKAKLRRHQLSKKCKQLASYKIDFVEVQEDN
jgi:hypothetical protein